MAGLNVGDLVAMRVVGSAFNQFVINTFNYRVTVASANANTLTACAVLAEDWLTDATAPWLSLRPLMSPQYAADFLGVQKISPTRWREVKTTMGLAGTNANDTTSVNQAATITRVCEESGRGFVGSLHLGALAGANMVDGNVTAGYKTLMNALATTLSANISSPTDGNLVLEPVIIHRAKDVEDDHWYITGATKIFTAFSQVSARTMRSRTVKGGE
jgi:hypothetical protein